MKKRLTTVAKIAFIFVVFVFCSACSSNSSPNIEPTDDQTASQTEDSSATTLPSSVIGYGDVGDGSAYIVASEGTTKDGAPLNLTINPDGRSAEVSVITENLSEQTPLYVYVDGELVKTFENPGRGGLLSLTSAQLTQGEHTVTFVQYDDGTSAGTITFYRTSLYSVS